MRHHLAACLLVACAVSVAVNQGHGQEAKPEAKDQGLTAIQPAAVNLGRPVDFEKDVYPILDAKCVACHNVAISENGLILEDVKSILKGGKRGPSVVPNDPEKSLLYRVSARAAQPLMPPLPNKVEAAAVTPQELGILKQWIVEGATAGAGSGSKAVQWHPLPKGIAPIYSVALTPDGQYVAFGRSNQVVIHHVPTGDLVAELTDPSLMDIQYNGKPMYAPGSSHRDFVHSLAFSPDGYTLASGGYREVKLWKRPAALQRFNIAASTGPVPAVAVSPDDKWLATVAADHTIRIWSLADGKEAKTLTGHTDAVTGLQFSTDSSKLLSSSKDKSVRVWAVADGAAAGKIDAPAPLNALTLNLDSTKVIAAGADNQIYVWDVPAAADAQVAAPTVITGHTGPVSSLALVLPAGTQVLSGSDDGTVRVWDLNSKAMVRNMAQGGPVTAVACRPDGQFFASAGTNNIARLWNAANGQAVAEMRGDKRAVKLLADHTADEAEAKALLTAATNAVPAAEKKMTDTAEAAKKASEAKDVAVKAATELAVKTKDAVDKAAAAKKAAEDKKDDAALAKAAVDAQKVASDAEAAQKKVDDEKDKATDLFVQAEKAAKEAADDVVKAKATLEAATKTHQMREATLTATKAAALEKEKPIRALAFSRDSKQLATSGDLGTVAVWDATTGLAFDVLDGHQGPVLALAFTSARLIVSGAADNTAKVWELNPAWTLAGVLGPKKEAPLDVNDSVFIDRVLCLDFNQDGTLLATGGGEPSRSGEVMIWDPIQMTVVRNITEAHSDTVFGIEFSRDGAFLASGAADKFVKIFEVATGKHVKSFEGHTNHVLDVTWRANGNQIASAGADNAIKIWNVETGEQSRTIAGYAKQVTSIQFMGRGGNVVSCGGDKTVRFHTADNGGNIRNFAGATDFMFAVAASDNEQIVVAAGQDGVLRVWNGTNAQALRQFDPPKPEDKPVADAGAQAKP